MTLVEEIVARPGFCFGMGPSLRQAPVFDPHATAPLCIGLAVLSAVRFMAHCVMAVQLERSTAGESTHPATLLGTLFEL